jgi:hypothetical protein
MAAIGFRAEPSALNWAVVDGTQHQPRLLGADLLKAPISFEEAAALQWFRDQTVHLYERFGPQIAAVRYAENVMGRSNQASGNRRCRVEGVLLEVSHSRGVKVSTGALITISKNLGTRRAKRYLENDDFRGIDWTSYPKNCQEAILIAVSALPAS